MSSLIDQGATPTPPGKVKPPSRIMTLNMGPQHPSTHGVLRLKVDLEGEVIRNVDVIMGYLHRSVEKLGEDGSYLQFIPLTDRLDYAQAMNNNHVFCHAVEKLMGAELPERAKYIRVMTLEINRLASHLLWFGTFHLDLGAITPFWWAIRDREGAIQLLERLSGARLTYNWMRIGGVKNDIPPGFMKELQRYINWMHERIPEYMALLEQNDIFRARLRGTGPLTAAQALNYGVSGPMLRASGVKFDLRKAEPYEAYEDFDFDIPTRTEGDCLARWYVRVEEMRQSLRILEQCIANMPDGDFLSPEIGGGARQHRIKPPKGEVYGRTESARGEMGAYIVSDGTNQPYRVKWRSPCLSNMHPLNDMVKGQKIPDLVATLGSVDIILGDIDR